MTQEEIRIARRLAVYMLECAEQQVDLHFYQGLGLALAIVFEETQNKPSGSVKPRELLEWAQSLPQVTYPHIKEN